MITSESHFLLFCEASIDSRENLWRFVLEDVNGRRRLAASDDEPEACRERLELLAVVRGLEAIDGPAEVTLFTKSRYVNRGLKRGLAEWRMNAWRWERFGKLIPVRDHDLWQRVDRALQFHTVKCRLWRFEDAESWESSEWDGAPARPESRSGQHRARPERAASWRQDAAPRRPTRARLIAAAKSRIAGATRKAAELGDRLAVGDGLAAG